MTIHGNRTYHREMEDAFRLNPLAECVKEAVMSSSMAAIMDNQRPTSFSSAVDYGSQEEEEFPRIEERAEGEEEVYDTIKAKIANHPRYPRLLQAYIDCRKVGAPPEDAALLEETVWLSGGGGSAQTCMDPELDEFMESYCKVLLKYKLELSRPLEEASSFLTNTEAQLINLCKASAVLEEGVGSSGEEASWGGKDTKGGNNNDQKEIKEQLLRRYSGYLSGLKREFLKKRSKGKLPMEARHRLLDWWNAHYKWPYPSESDKVELAESTGLDPKQINNWFINQRKRHWKPSEDMQHAVMESVSGPTS
ncbi:hypothetical protein AMTRI_Chr02g265780 [Amborella trichopoda]